MVSHKPIPERRCVGCSERKTKKELIRIVRLPDGGGVEVDLTGKKSGRGAYICPNKACLRRARKRLETNLGCEIPDEVFARLESELDNADG